MNFKDFYKSINLKNNKIINAKTDEPTHEDHIVSKKFVERKTIYNTAKVLEYINPFKLTWVTNPVNKTILELFDDVFFPQLNPEYINPKFDKFLIEKSDPNIVFINTTNTGFKVNWAISQSDRTLNQAPKIVITKTDNSITTIVVDNAVLIGEKSFNIDWTNILKIEFVAVFNPTTVIKQDTYGNDYVPSEFLTIYELKHNILSDIQSDNIIVPALFYRKIQQNENVEDIVDQTAVINLSSQLMTQMSYTRTNKNLIVTPGIDNFYVLLVPKQVYDEYLMFIGGDNIPASVLTRNQMMVVDGVQFYLNTMDLGYYANQSVLEIKFRLKAESLENMLLENYYLINDLGKIDSIYLDIINDLTTGGENRILSAEQGKVIGQKIQQIETILASDDINLDSIQEIIDAIKNVRTSLETILVNDLTTGGITKALTAEMGKLLQTNKVDKVLGSRLINTPEIEKLNSLQNFEVTGLPGNLQKINTLGDEFENSSIFENDELISINKPIEIDSLNEGQSGLKFKNLKTINSISSAILGSSGQYPYNIAIDNDGNIFTCNFSANTVTKITPDGVSSILGSTGANPTNIAVDIYGNVYTANYNSNNVTKITPDGVSSIFGTTGIQPRDLIVDSTGNVFTANAGSNNVTKISNTGVSTIYGTTGANPQSITKDIFGNIFTTNYSENTVSKITNDGVSIIFGTTGNLPNGIATDLAGNVYTANTGSNNVTKITIDGVSSILGVTNDQPRAIITDELNNIYVANFGSNNVTKITPLGISSIFAYVGTNPSGIVLDKFGNIYTSNNNSHNVSKITVPQPQKALTVDDDGNVIFHDNLINPADFKTVNGKSIFGSGDIDTSLINPNNIGSSEYILDLVNENKLVPGNYYMINDFQTIYTIEGSDSQPFLNKRTITSIVSNYATLDYGYDSNLINGKSVTITKLPNNYSGSLVVGGVTTVSVNSSDYYFRFANGMQNIIGLEFSYTLPRYTNGIADNLVVNDTNNKPVIKPGGVLNIEVHDGTAYMDMLASENLDVPIESLVLRAKTTNEFELEGKSATYIDDVIEYKLPTSGSVSTKGTILRRYNKALNIDIRVDWRVQRYRRWKIDASSILKILNQDQPVTSLTGFANTYQFTATKSTTATPNRFYIAKTLDDKSITIDENTKIVNFTMVVSSYTSAKDYTIFKLDENHQPVDVEKMIVSETFSNTIIQNNIGELNYNLNIYAESLSNNTFVCSSIIQGQFLKIYNSLFLDTFTINSNGKTLATIDSCKILSLLITYDIANSILVNCIIGVNTNNYGGAPYPSVRWIYFGNFSNSILESCLLGGSITHFNFNCSRIIDCTLFFYYTYNNVFTGSNISDTLLLFNNCLMSKISIFNRAKLGNVIFDSIMSDHTYVPTSGTDRDVYVNPTNLYGLKIEMNKYTKELYYLEMNALNVPTVNTYATKTS